jgi:hypothetical protein
MALLPIYTLKAQDQPLPATSQLVAKPGEEGQTDSKMVDKEKEKINQKNQELQKAWDAALANPLDIHTGEKLKQMIGQEADRQGLVTGIMSGLVLLYSTLSNLLLHPILTITLILLTIGLIIFVVLVVLRIRKGKFSSLGRLISFGVVYLLLYIDLLLMMYEEKEVSKVFFRWDKDIVLVVLASLLGYLAGRHASQRSFEEKVLP